MQKAIRLNENQLQHLASKAKQENTLSGKLYKKSTDTGKWQLRWFALYQNLLFYYESDTSTKPSGVLLLEGCYCERLITPSSVKGKESEKQIGVKYSFAIYYRPENLRQYELRNDTEAECNAWVDAIKTASYSKVLEQKEELEQKHLHLLQILDSERQAKWQYVQQCEELTTEVKKLKNELKEYKNEIRFTNHLLQDVESDELKKIKKVQSFFRGWLCRRRWKQIVDEYIRSEHAESMRKRNSIVFGMVECEEEYVRQLSTLVSCFLRPFRMAASSKKPPITHEDVNSVFLNSETVLFLHQIFLKGLSARMENWPTLVLGDLFDMLLPMLGIYQEYVRNHHFSLQVLAEYKQKIEFNTLLKRYEEKPTCEGRSLETFLTYPMHQIPRYIITLHELLAHTPHDHVERKKLEFAKGKLEELSHIMHDEVSETENIRKNLSIERMIVEGCDILLDVNQTFVRQGSLLQVINDRSKSGRGRLGSFGSSFKESKKEQVRQVFLFTYHMLLTTRASNGRLHLCKHYGKIPLADCTLVEDSSSDVFFFDEDTSSVDTQATSGHGGSTTNLLSASSCDRDRSGGRIGYNGLDFRLIVDTKSGPPVTITMVASTLQEKAAWCSDISQCIENLHYSDLLNSSMSDTSSVTMPQSVSSLKLPRTPPSRAKLEHLMLCECDRTKARSDPKLFRDDTDIKFSRSLNSCKVPKIRHASVDRLLERLTDLRFLSIDFLNTFLLTYRVFTTGRTVLEALRRVVINPEYGNLDHKRYSTISVPPAFEHHHHGTGEVFSTSPPNDSPAPSRGMTHLIKPQPEKSRRVSTDDRFQQSTKTTKLERVPSDERQEGLSPYKHKPLAPIASSETLYDQEVDNVSCSSTGQSGTGHSPPTLEEEDEGADDEDDSPPPVMLTLSEAPGESTTDLVPPPPTPITGSMETLNQIPGVGTVIVVEPCDSEPGTPVHKVMNVDERPAKRKVSIAEPVAVMVIEPSDDEGGAEDPELEQEQEIHVVEPPEEPSIQPMRSDSITDPTICGSLDQDEEDMDGVAEPTTNTPPMEPRISVTEPSPTPPEIPEGDPEPSEPRISVTEPPEDITEAEGEDPPPIVEPRVSVTEPPKEAAPLPRRMDSLTAESAYGVEPIEEEMEEEPIPSSTPRISVVEPQIIETQVVEPTTIEPASSASVSIETLVPDSPTSTDQSSSAPYTPATPVSATRPKKFDIPPAIHIPEDSGSPSSGGPKYVRAASPQRRNSPVMQRAVSPVRRNSPVMQRATSPCSSPKQKRPPSPISYSFSSPSINVNPTARRSSSIKPASEIEPTFSPRASIAAGAEGSPPPTKVGAVVTSSRASKRSRMMIILEGGCRRSSSTAAASAFAVATAGAANPPSGHPRGINRFNSAGASDMKQQVPPCMERRQTVISAATTMRVLNVLKHWVSKHSQDFDSDPQLKQLVKDLLEDMVCNSSLLPAEHKAAASILKTILKEDHDPNKVDLTALLAPPSTCSRDTFDSLSALDIAEQLTYLDHQIFKSIRSEELLGQSWMKCDKGDKAPHVLLVSKRFNEVSRLVVSEIVGRVGIMDRVSCIEKWAAIADICRCMHNYNGVLQICAAFVNSSVYRLKRTWDRIPKQTKQMIERLQTLVSSDGRFKNMRDALHRCDPPCIPYLGMYLTDLSFIEEGTPNVTDDGLVNFSKMRMIAHVIREIQLFQQTPYRIEHHPRVTSYLLDDSRLLEEEETYRQSLLIEPRQSIARNLAPTTSPPQT